MMKLFEQYIRLSNLLSPFKAVACVAATILMTQSAIAAEKPSLLGEWTLNRELTEERRPELPKAKGSRTGFGSQVQVGVGGVLLPNPGSRTGGPSAGGSTANLPKVLGCLSLKLEQVGDAISVTCPEMLEARSFRIGKYHGRNVKWSRKNLSENYRSTSRRVTHSFKLEKENLMQIKVTVKPKQSKRLTYIMVFDRVSENEASTT